jgi:hypothetical protein
LDYFDIVEISSVDSESRESPEVAQDVQKQGDHEVTNPQNGTAKESKLDPTAKPFTFGQTGPPSSFVPILPPALPSQVLHPSSSSQAADLPKEPQVHRPLAGAIRPASIKHSPEPLTTAKLYASPSKYSSLTSEETTSEDETPAATLAFTQPEIKVDHAADDRRFREWVFPSAEAHANAAKPSISRRHTMPDEAIPDDPFQVVQSGHTMAGIASTSLATRVGDLRAMLGRPTSADAPEGDEDEVRDISRSTSVEFPIRAQNRELAVVNGTPKRRSRSSSVVQPAVEEADVSELLRQLQATAGRLEQLVAEQRVDVGRNEDEQTQLVEAVGRKSKEDQGAVLRAIASKHTRLTSGVR